MRAVLLGSTFLRLTEVYKCELDPVGSGHAKSPKAQATSKAETQALMGRELTVEGLNARDRSKCVIESCSRPIEIEPYCPRHLRPVTRERAPRMEGPLK